MRRTLLLLLFLSASVFAARFTVDNATVCPCQFGTLHVNTSNIQDTPFYTTLFAESALSVFPQSRDIQVGPYSSATAIFEAAAACDAAPGDYPVRFEPAGITATVHVNACSGFALSVTPYQATCQNQHADYAVRLENLGSDERQVHLGTDLAPDSYTLAQTATLSAHETKTLILSVNTNAVPQRLAFKVVARSNDAYQEQPAILEISACSGIRFTSGTRFSLTEGGAGSFSVQFQNLGKSRTLDVRAYCPPFVTANATKMQVSGAAFASVNFTASNAPLGTHSCTLFVDPLDEGKSYSHTFSVDVAPTRAHLSVTPANITLENGVTRRIAFTFANPGTPLNGSVTLTSPRTQQFEPVPFVVADQNTRTAELVLSGTSIGTAQGQLHVGTATLPVNLAVVPATLVMNATAYENAAGTAVDVSLTNNGDATIVALSSRPQSTGPTQVFLPANTTTTVALLVSDENASALAIQLQTDRGTYEAELDIQNKRPAPQTGLVSFATPVIAFAAAILLALILLYFLYRESRTRNGGTPSAGPTGATPSGQKTLAAYE